MKIGNKIKALRIQKNLTQEELADRCELSKGFISQLERDLTSPSIATLIDILQCLGTDLREFFNDTVEEQIAFHETELVFDLGRAMIKARRTLQSREIFYLVLFSKWQTRKGIIPSTNVVYSLSRLYY